MVTLTGIAHDHDWIETKCDFSDRQLEDRVRSFAVFAPSSGNAVLAPSSGNDDLDDTVREANTPSGNDTVAETLSDALTFADAEIVEVLADRVECWVRMSPQFRVRMRISKDLLEGVRLIPGVCFEWSVSQQTARPCQVDPMLAQDIADLERQL